MINITELETLARAATPGEWRQNNCCNVFGPLGGDSGDGRIADSNDAWQVADTAVGVTSTGLGVLTEIGFDMESRNAAYIAAANPATILKLIEVIRAQHKALEEISDSDPDECAGRLRDIANEVIGGWEDD